MNAFVTCTENKPIKKYVNRPNNQRHDILVPLRPVGSSGYLPAVDESQEHKVKRYGRISGMDQWHRSVAARKST